MAADRAIYDKLKEEVRREIPEWPGTGSLPESEHLPSVSLLQNLPYTNAVLQEALRRYPTIPGTMPRIVTSSSLKLGSLNLPKNVSIDRFHFPTNFARTLCQGMQVLIA